MYRLFDGLFSKDEQVDNNPVLSDIIHNLPTEISLKILVSLPDKDLVQCQSVSKQWFSLCQEPVLSEKIKSYKKHLRSINENKQWTPSRKSAFLAQPFGDAIHLFNKRISPPRKLRFSSFYSENSSGFFSFSPSPSSERSINIDESPKVGPFRTPRHTPILSLYREEMMSPRTVGLISPHAFHQNFMTTPGSNSRDYMISPAPRTPKLQKQLDFNVSCSPIQNMSGIEEFKSPLPKTPRQSSTSLFGFQSPFHQKIKSGNVNIEAVTLPGGKFLAMASSPATPTSLPKIDSVSPIIKKNRTPKLKLGMKRL